jgi:hypothetical protein
MFSVDAGGAGESSGRYRSGTPLCRACGRSVADDDPALYELIVDGKVAAVVLGADEPFAVPPGAALVDIFHPSCFRKLVEEWTERGQGAWSGRCPLSGQKLIAPHPLDDCPVCGAPVIAD